MQLNVSPVSFKGVTTPKKPQNAQVNKNLDKLAASYMSKPDHFFWNSKEEEAEVGKISEKLKEDVGGIAVTAVEVMLKAAPKKIPAAKKLLERKDLEPAYAATLILMSPATEKLKSIADYAHLKNDNNEYKYDAKDLAVFATLGKEEVKNIQPLTQTSLNSENIMLLGKKSKERYGSDNAAKKKFLTGLALNVILTEQTVLKKDFKKIDVDSSKYQKDSYVISAKKNNGENVKILYNYDKYNSFNKESISTETMQKDKNGNDVKIVKTTDFTNNNNISKTRYKFRKAKAEVIDPKTKVKKTKMVDVPYVTDEVRIIKDSSGKVQRTEYTTSSDIPGVFDITARYPDGREEMISSGKINKKTGIMTVKKNMTSANGTKTEYLFEDDKNGNRISEYKITDKDGNVLLNKNSTFEVVGENRIISSNNGDAYEILLGKDKIKVTDMKDPNHGAEIDIDKSIKGNKQLILTSLKEMPGEELIKLAQSTKTLVATENYLGSYFDPADKTLCSSTQLFAFMHELGHARDSRDHDTSSFWKKITTPFKSIFANKEFINTYNKEREAFVKAYPETQRDYIEYFTNINSHYAGSFGGMRETIAESNALLTTPLSPKELSIRSQYLQQHFPETIAVVSKLMSEENAQSPAMKEKQAQK